MKAAILSVGTEILFGQIVNTNTVYLSRKLNTLGIDVMYHYTAGDNSGRLADMLKMAFRDCDMVITTGGLGPTEDDLTKETVCEVMGDTLEMNEKCLSDLEAIFSRRGYTLTENNYKQAMMPTKAVVFDNDAGTAPGFALTTEGKTVICMPGPPREMTRMWERRVRPYLLSLSDSVIYYRLLRTFGIGESKLETVLLPLIDAQTDPTLATYAKEGECSLRIASKRRTLEEAKAAVDAMAEKVSEIVGEYIYSYDDEDLHQVVGKKLIERNITVSACESCTGGMFAEKLVSVPGISAVFDRGLVTYTERAKIDELSVRRETLEKYTAESREVALEMVRGLKKKTGSRLCISVTGVAGPDAMGEKPAGLIYIAVSFDGREDVRVLNTGKSDRQANRNAAVLHMFDLINKTIG